MEKRISLVMIEMLGGTRMFAGQLYGMAPSTNDDSYMQNVVEIKEVILPGPQDPMVYHVGILIGTMPKAPDIPHTFVEMDLCEGSPILNCYNNTLNPPVIEAPNPHQAHKFAKKVH